MGQAAGVKRRKRRAGNYNILKNRKQQHRKAAHLQKAGLQFLGLGDGDGGQCLLTRIEQGGLVANLNRFGKPDPMQLVHKAMEKKNSKATNKSSNDVRSNLDLVKTVETKRVLAKQKVVERQGFMLSKPEVRLITYFLDRYGEDYEAMRRDPMNFDQHTATQLRKKVISFKKSGSQFAEYLKDRGLIPVLMESEASHPALESTSKLVASTEYGKDVEEKQSSEQVCVEVDEAEEINKNKRKQDEKLLAKMNELKRELKLAKIKMTGRTKKPKLVEDAPSSAAEDSEGGDSGHQEDESGNTGLGEISLSKQSKINKRRHARMKKFKKSKLKRIEKEKKKFGIR